jgi:hypothetical protein
MAMVSSPNIVERLGTQGDASYTLGEYRSIAGNFCEAIEKRARAQLPDGNQRRRASVCNRRGKFTALDRLREE